MLDWTKKYDNLDVDVSRFSKERVWRTKLSVPACKDGWFGKVYYVVNDIAVFSYWIWCEQIPHCEHISIEVWLHITKVTSVFITLTIFA